MKQLINIILNCIYATALGDRMKAIHDKFDKAERPIKVNVKYVEYNDPNKSINIIPCTGIRKEDFIIEGKCKEDFYIEETDKEGVFILKHKH